MIDRAKLFDAVEDVRELIDAGTTRADIILHLVRRHGGTYRDASGTYELRLAGLRCSCTAGPICLVAEWLEKARAELRGSDDGRQACPPPRQRTPEDRDRCECPVCRRLDAREQYGAWQRRLLPREPADE